MNDFTLRDLQTINSQRDRGSYNSLADWTPLEWGGALAGEVGEVCNLLKKYRRDGVVDLAEVGKEIADCQCYLALLAEAVKLDLQEITRQKFNEVSERIGALEKL